MKRPTEGGRYIRDPKAGTVKKADEVPVETETPATDAGSKPVEKVEKKGK